MTRKIAVLPGDGIGPEIMDQAIKVLKALGEDFEYEYADVGGVAYAHHGHPLPEQTLALAKEADAVLFGAVGDFKYDTLERHLRPEQAILGLRKNLNLFANLRPAVCYPELVGASTLRPEVIKGVDMAGSRHRPRAHGRRLLRPAARPPPGPGRALQGRRGGL